MLVRFRRWEVRSIRISWPYPACIICLAEEVLTCEHIIPESLGGQLFVDFLCAGCNSRFGHAVDATAKSDPSVALAIHQFHRQHPEKAGGLREGMPYQVRSADGTSKARVKRGKLQTQSAKLADGSLVQPASGARKSVTTMLRRAGYPNAPLQEALQKFDAAPDGERVEIVPGLDIAKWPITQAVPDLSGSPMSPFLSAKIAYEFLACHVGDSIYGTTGPLAELRRVLGTLSFKSAAVSIENLRADRSQPIHGIVVERSEPNVVIQIRLFGSLAYRVHFPRVCLSGPRYFYTHDLVSKREGIRLVPEHIFDR